MKRKMKTQDIKPLFLLGKNPEFIRSDGLGIEVITGESKIKSRVNEILGSLELELAPPLIVRKEEDFEELNLDFDIYIVFSQCLERYSSLVDMAENGKILILTAEEGLSGNILDTYEYLSGYSTVFPVHSFKELRLLPDSLDSFNHIMARKICLFNMERITPENYVWYSNFLFEDKLNTDFINPDEFAKKFRSVDRNKALNLAEQWMDDEEVIEPTVEDVAKSAEVYLAMKETIEDMGANAAYVLWCGQFSSLLHTKMCFAISKLNEEGILTGCWRGGNLLPMLILNEVTGKGVFSGEVHMWNEGILSVRHCAVPGIVSDCRYILRRWRNREGTVTGYCEMPEGEVTLISAGRNGELVPFRGVVVDCRDIEGENCRTTVWVKPYCEEKIHDLKGREIAMVYGDCEDEVRLILKLIKTH